MVGCCKTTEKLVRDKAFHTDTFLLVLDQYMAFGEKQMLAYRRDTETLIGLLRTFSPCQTIGLPPRKKVEQGRTLKVPVKTEAIPKTPEDYRSAIDQSRDARQHRKNLFKVGLAKMGNNSNGARKLKGERLETAKQQLAFNTRRYIRKSMKGMRIVQDMSLPLSRGDEFDPDSNDEDDMLRKVNEGHFPWVIHANCCFSEQFPNDNREKKHLYRSKPLLTFFVGSEAASEKFEQALSEGKYEIKVTSKPKEYMADFVLPESRTKKPKGKPQKLNDLKRKLEEKRIARRRKNGEEMPPTFKKPRLNTPIA
jgi:hypothetical protein